LVGSFFIGLAYVGVMSTSPAFRALFALAYASVPLHNATGAFAVSAFRLSGRVFDFGHWFIGAVFAVVRRNSVAPT